MLVVSFWSVAARAGDPAAAESLYQDARTLLAARDAKAACPKLEESQRLDPTGATALLLARCYEELGRVASAWARYEEALVFARAKGAHAREREIEARLASIARDVPKVSVVVSVAVGRTPGLEILRGAVPIGEGQWNTPIALDPGPVTISARAPGRLPWSIDIVVKVGESRAIEVPALADEALPAASPPAAAAPVVSAPQPQPTQRVPPSQPPPPPSRSAAVAMLAVGGAALGVGAYFSWRWSTLSSEAKALCDSSRCGDDAHARAVAKSDDAGVAGKIGVASFAVGAVLTGVGASLWLRPSPTPSTAWVPWVDQRVVGGAVARSF